MLCKSFKVIGGHVQFLTLKVPKSGEKKLFSKFFKNQKCLVFDALSDGTNRLSIKNMSKDDLSDLFLK